MKNKQFIREQFRYEVYVRDNYTCQVCGKKGTEDSLDAHHITNRNDMPNGGYVKENGVSLCCVCHFVAEEFNNHGHAPEGYMPDDLYIKIKSSYEEAVNASEKLKV